MAEPRSDAPGTQEGSSGDPGGTVSSQGEGSSGTGRRDEVQSQDDPDLLGQVIPTTEMSTFCIQLT